ncbi:hypothetical protein [Massilia frigida]|uniref:hypothetical protein n=1 Tax=Massilia frigida TaxID=2609281 RepID=UPI0014209C3B|nr:hypothetical protein [Massilia frigida]
MRVLDMGRCDENQALCVIGEEEKVNGRALSRSRGGAQECVLAIVASIVSQHSSRHLPQPRHATNLLPDRAPHAWCQENNLSLHGD